MTQQRSAPDGRTAGRPAYPATAVVDEAGRVMRWSPGAERLLGHRAVDVVGRPAAGLLADEGTADASVPMLAGRRRWAGRVSLRHRDGRRVETTLLAHRRVSGSGNPEWLLVSPPLREPPVRGTGEPLLELVFDQSPQLIAVFDTDLRLLRVNAEMQRAVDFSEDELRGFLLSEVVVHPEGPRLEALMRHVLEGHGPRFVETDLRAPGAPIENPWAISLGPVTDGDGSIRGVTLAALDLSKRQHARDRLLLLNEAAGRIGSTLDLEHTAQELADVAVPRLADYANVDVLAHLTEGDEPPPGSVSGEVSMLRLAHQSVLEGCPESLVGPGGTVVYPEFSPPAECLADGRPALLEITTELLDRWTSRDPARGAKIRAFGTHSALVVPIRARGTTLGVAVFTRHRTPEPFGLDDRLMLEEITARAAVCIDNARRYARERATAITLQRSLLPQSLPHQAAVEIASRYLPAGARAGVGGDWFDVIPLSGARVALVVGDVVGHGIQASATMGRLRTAVRTLADIDLPPDELLTHLDDLVTRLPWAPDTADNADAAPESAGDVGATCLYAIYDPLAQRCTLARAGHPEPVVVTPGGRAAPVDLPVGPPLGLGGLPFESAEIDLPEGSLLALYTNGLVEGRHDDIGLRQAAFHRSLAQPTASLDDICDNVLAALLPDRTDDDVALLIARTRALDTDQVASWDVPPDPAAVAAVRKQVSDQLERWGLCDVVFTTELVVSELVTNAIRHAKPPIHLRLIHDRTLICEVSDASSTAPHLRRARVFDEGGRGLLLVAQLTERWGTRQGRTGKTIWAEQSLSDQ
ncbi:SpoIIE family protein phosphatase [Streptomyces sp. NPDC002004]